MTADPTLTSFALLVGIAAVLSLWYRWIVDEHGGFLFWAWIAACFFVGVRPLVLVLGLDTTFPDGAIAAEQRSAAVTAGSILVLLWCSGAGLTAWWCSRAPSTGARVSPPVDQDRALVIAAGLAATVASILLVWLIVRLGGPGTAITALKRDGLGGNARFFAVAKNAGLVASMAGAATVVSALRSNRPVIVTARRALIFVVPAALTFAVGARDAIVFGAVAIVGATLHRPGGLDRRTALRIGGAVVAVLLLGIGLRIGRDLAISSSISESVAGQNLARQIAITTNMTSFDALVHARYITPAEFGFVGGGDFRASFEGLPLVPGEPPPDYERPALRIIRHHVPTRLNGNPLTAIGDWYVAFGVTGTIVGGLVSGALLGMLARIFRSASDDAVIHVVGTVTALRILPLGISATTPSVGLQFALATLAFVAVLRTVMRWLGSTPATATGGISATRPHTTRRAARRAVVVCLVAAGVGAAVGGSRAAAAEPVVVDITVIRLEPGDIVATDLAVALRRVGTEPLTALVAAEGIDAVIHVSADLPYLIVAVEAADADASHRATATALSAVSRPYPEAEAIATGTPTTSRATSDLFVTLASAVTAAAATAAVWTLIDDRRRRVGA